ncbi:glycosyltransferase family 4 protein [Diaminobutyricibacter sp. McL0608]|uniref:glycosyltransferase family 4 protein n=1 Tax=Leifsonia sp. McL0608 TaxID=3143537 RepID=UPI0031F2F3A6
MPESARRPRVVIASRIFEPEGGAGAFRLGALARALDAAGFDLRVLTTRPPDGEYARDDRIRRWPVLRDRTGAVRGYIQYATFDVPLFFRLLFSRRPDAIVVEPPPTTGFAVYLASRLKRTGYVYFAADILSTASQGIGVSPAIVRVLRAVEGFVLRKADAVLAVSDGVASELLTFGVAPERITVVGTGIDTAVFSPDGARPEPAGPYLVYAGTMSEIQGAQVFVEAFRRISGDFPTARLVMLGRGTELPLLREIAAPLGPERVVFAGQVRGEAVAFWLRGARASLASVRPDRGYDFAFATKAFTSLSCGTPVIYAGEGATRRVIEEHRLGITVDWKVDAVVEAMKTVLTDPADSAERGRLSAWASANVSLDAVGAKSVLAVEKVIDLRGRA